MKKPCRYSAIFWAMFACLAVVTPSNGDKVSDEIFVERVTELQRSDGDIMYFSNLDLGHLPVGKPVVVHVTLKNPFDDAIKFSGVSNKCACKQFSSRDSLIPAGGQAVAKFTISTPARQRSFAVETSISLVEKSDPVVKLDMTYKLDGLLAFTELLGVVRFEGDEKTQTKEIPFIFSPPIDLQKVSARATGKLKQATIEISKTDKGGLLKVIVPEKVVANGNVRGEVYIDYAETKQTDCYYLSAKDARVNEISPKVIQFQSKAGKWQASAIVKIAGLVEQPNANADPPDVDVENKNSSPIQCKFLGEGIEVHTKPLKNNTFRVQLVASVSQIEKMRSLPRTNGSDDNSLIWEINNGRKTSKTKTDFRIDEP